MALENKALLRETLRRTDRMVGMIDPAKVIRVGARALTALRGAAPAALILALAVYFGVPEKAAALPSFARQTG